MRIHRITVSFLLFVACSMAGTAVAFTLPETVAQANERYAKRRQAAIETNLKWIWEHGAKNGDWSSSIIDDKGRLAINTVMVALAACRDRDNITYKYPPPANFQDMVVKTVKDVFSTNSRLLGTRSKGMWTGKPGDLDMDFVRVMTLLLEFDETNLKPEARAHIVRQLFNIKRDHTQGEDMSQLTLQTEVTPAVKNAETENHTLSINTSKYLLNQYVHEQLKGNSPTGKLLREAGFKDASKYDPAKLTRIRDWILQACARVLHNDLFETNARPYQGITFLPLFNIYAYSKDVALQNAARNAMDAIAAKIAFQSYQGTRYPPIRRSNEHMHEYQLLRYDYLLSTMGILSGARPGVNWRGVVAVMLKPDKPRYELPAIVHSYFLNQSYSYWARMQGQYTTKHYEYGKDPKYFVDGKAFKQGDFVPAMEFYFRTPSFLNTSGGRYEHYPVSVERSLSHWTVYGGAYAYDFLSVPQTVITHRVMEEDDNNEINSSEKLTNHPNDHKGGMLNMMGNERRFWKSDNSGTFKNFSYGFRYPSNKSSDSACRPGYEEQGELCYKPCKPGYKGVVTRCLEKCPAGMVDDGLTCREPIETKTKKSHGRTAGKPMGCASDQEKDASLCYNKCGSGYHGIANYCYRDCPSGFRDDGLYCYKPNPYGRGAGYPWKPGDPANLDNARARCKKDHPQGCETHGAIIYPKCKEGFHAAGCCTCSPDCPTGMKDIGVSCEKQKFSRGVGKPLHTCAADQDRDGLLCYPRCRTGYHGKGPLCWEDCPSGYTDTGAFCTKGGKVTTPKSYDRGAGEVPLRHDAFGEPTNDAYTKKPWNVPSFFNYSKCKMIRIGDMVEVRLCDNLDDLDGPHDFYVVLGWIRDNGTKEYSRGFWEIVPKTRFTTVDDLTKHIQEVNKDNFPAKGNFKYRLATSGDLVELRRDLSYVKDIGRSCNSPIVSIQDQNGKTLHSPDGQSEYYYNQCKDSHGVPFVASLPLMEVFEVDENYRFTGNILAYAKGGRLCVITKNSKLCLDSTNYKNPTRSETKCTGGACSLKPW